jgi:hypothetical protein
MPNPRGNPETLTSFKTQWNNHPTRTIRVPVALADEALAFARRLDEGETQGQELESETLTQVIEDLKELVDTPRNNFSSARKRSLMRAIKQLEALTQV